MCSARPSWHTAPATCRSLAPLALRIMALSGTATETERNWKDFDHVVSIRRNRLKHETASMLVRMYGHLREPAGPRSQRRLPASVGDGDDDILEVRADGAADDGVEEDRLVEELDSGGVESDFNIFCEREDIQVIRIEFFADGAPSANLV